MNQEKSKTIPAQDDLWAVCLNKSAFCGKDEVEQFVHLQRVVAWNIWMHDPNDDGYTEPLNTTPVTCSTTCSQWGKKNVDHDAVDPNKIPFVGKKRACANWVKKYLVDGDSGNPELAENLEREVEKVDLVAG